ncbi:MAG: hypothetical protein OFPII_09660 [Osedax symbiont Rs1]|nr:MAG: hypothetical protein OFPII_09660 [Osedax symbiont Rs1]
MSPIPLNQDRLNTWIDSQLTAALAVSPLEVRRLFHGRSGTLEGYQQVVVDWLANVAVIRLYKDIEADKLDALVEFLSVKPEVKGVLIQQRGRQRETKFRIAYGEVAETLLVEESGLVFQIAPLQHQNFGLFLDMRNGRHWLKQQAKNAKVLNLFAYTCAFSVAAVSGGAKLVVNVDLSKRALSTGRINHQLNTHAKSATQFMPYDMLKSWSRIKKPGPYDIVVIDPPSFQPGSFIAQKDYIKVLRRLDELTSPKAKVMICHNDPSQTSEFVRQLMQQACSAFKFQERLAVPQDFAEADAEKSLKVLIYQKT